MSADLEDLDIFEAIDPVVLLEREGVKALPDDAIENLYSFPDGQLWSPGASELLSDGVRVTFNETMPQEPQMVAFRALLLSVLAEKRNMSVKDLSKR